MHSMYSGHLKAASTVRRHLPEHLYSVAMSGYLTLAFLVATWLVASIPFGLVLTTYLGTVDIRQVGSGNIGATNVYRIQGRNLGAWTLVLDLLKAAVPVYLAMDWGATPLLPQATALVAFIGHCWSPWLRFEGGKGVAVSAGALLPMVPAVALCSLALWLAVVFRTRRSALGALTAVLAAPILTLLLATTRPYVPAVVLLSLGILLRHRGNIQRLLEGRELSV